MAIVSSSIISKHKQVDGRFYVTEHHVTDTGVVIPITYLADAEDDHEARMLARVPELEAALVKEREDADAELLLATTREKLDTHLASFTDQQLKETVGLTDEEVQVFKDKIKP